MRTRLILGFVMACGLLPLPASAERVAQLGDHVLEQFDSELANLKSELSRSKKPEDPWKALKKTEDQMDALRKKASLQSDGDEIYMDTVVMSLKQIPRDKDFKKSECPDYRTHLLAGFDPHGEENPSPALAETLSILKILCGL